MFGSNKSQFSVTRLFGTENCIFKVVIAHESPLAAVRAEEMRERLATRFQHSINIESIGWDFELLSCPQICEEAAVAAASADMVIISADGAIELPRPVKAWIESWLPRKCNAQSSLVALLNEEYEIFGEPPLVGAYLREIAGKAGMDFFCNIGDRQQHFAVRQPQLFAVGDGLAERFRLTGMGFA